MSGMRARGVSGTLPLRRFAVYLVGIVTLCSGVVLNTKTGLGTSAMSTIPYSIHLIEGLSLGTATTAIYAVFVITQLLLLRHLDVRVILQIPVSLLFGVAIDIFDLVVFRFQAQGLADGIPMLIVAIALTALGVTLVVSARIVPVATDGLVQTLSDVLGWAFGRTKYAFDVSCLAVTLAYTMLRVGHPLGIGLGTVVAVLLTGGACAVWGKLLGEHVSRFMAEGGCGERCLTSEPARQGQ